MNIKKAAFLILTGVSSFLLIRTEIVHELLYLQHHPFNPSLEVSKQDLPLDLEEFLSQPMHFLGIGSQCIVFSPKNSPYVLKICKANRYQPFSYLTKWPLSSFFNPSLERKEKKKEEDFFNYKLAFTELKEQTGILYLHLNKTDHLKKKITLVDPLFFFYRAKADDLVFYIQKKAIPLRKYVLQLKQENKTQEIQSLFQSLIKMVSFNAKCGIRMKDIHPEKNIGVCQNQPMWIDPGRMKKYPSAFSIERENKAISHIRLHLNRFFQELDPSFSESSLEQQISS